MMPDDNRRRRTPILPNSIVASATLLNDAKQGRILPPEGWMNEAWHYYDAVPEVRFATNYLQNAGSRIRLMAARIGQSGDEPEPIDSGPAFDAMEQLAGGTTGQSEMMGDFFVHLSVPGICYLAGEPSGSEVESDPFNTWQVLSADELTKEQGRYRVAMGPANRDFRHLAPDALVCKVWRSHKRWHFRPDSPMRACLTVLRELELLGMHVDATAVSRLAGAGILVVPTEITFPVSEKNRDAADPFVAELMDAMLTPIRDRDAASAVVPFVIRVPGEWVDKITHLTFASPLDEKAMSLREEAITRFASGVDLPAEVVKGLANSNHWTAWQIEESAVKLHIEPMAEAACAGLTKGYLHPALKAASAFDQDIIVWYDTTELKVRPDRSQDAKDVFAADAIGAAALRRETGFDESDAPSDDETQRKVLLEILDKVPTLAPIILPLLGINLTWPAEEPLPGPRGTSSGMPVAAPGAPVAPGTEPTAPVAPAVPGGPPDTQNAPPPPPGSNAALAAGGALAHEDALLAACDGLVVRALERAGSRLRSVARSEGMVLAGPADTLHLVAALDLRTAHLDDMLEGAWERVPVLAERYAVEPHALASSLDDYVRSLIAGGWPHEWQRLVDVLGG